MTTIRIELDWLPPSAISGNKRGHWSQTAKKIKEVRDSGKDHGRLLNSNGHEVDLPLTGQLELRYIFYTKARRDWVNLAFGMKPFEDGLQDAVVFVDDFQIERAIVERRKGADRTIVEIRTI